MSIVRNRWILLAVVPGVVAMLSVTGCGKRGEPPPVAQDGEIPATKMPNTRVVVVDHPSALFEDDTPLPVLDQIELLDRGQAPRAPRRYQLAELPPRSFTVAVKVALAQVVDAKIAPTIALPEIRYGLGFSNAHAVKDHAVVVDLFGLRAEVATEAHLPGAAKQLAEAQAEVFRAHLERQRGSAAIGDRGTLGEIAIASPDPDQDTARARQEIAQLLIEAIVVWPEQPIGAGARWRVRHRLRRGAHVVAQDAAYQLIEFDGQRARIRAEIDQLGEPQWVPPSYLPAGSTGELILLRWHAEGELTVDLAVPTPVTGQLAVVLTNHGRITSGGRTRDLFSESKGTLVLATK